MSSDDEFDALIALEDDLVASLHGENAMYIGRATTRGFRVFYFYSAEPEAFTPAAKAVMKRHPAYGHEIGTQTDPNWSTYFDFLYPSPEYYQRIKNRRLS